MEKLRKANKMCKNVKKKKKFSFKNEINLLKGLSPLTVLFSLLDTELLSQLIILNVKMLNYSD